MASWPAEVTDSGATTTAAASPFRSAAEHLLAETDRLKLLLHGQVLRLRATALLREDQFRGLYISDEEVDAILSQNSSTSSQSCDASASSTLQSLAHQIDAASAQLVARFRASQVAGVNLPLFRISRIFNLSRFEQFALLVCVAP